MVDLHDELRTDDATDHICTDMGINPDQLFWYLAVRNGRMPIETVLRDGLLDGRTAVRLKLCDEADAYRITGRLPYTFDEIADENLRLRGEGRRVRR